MKEGNASRAPPGKPKACHCSAIDTKEEKRRPPKRDVGHEWGVPHKAGEEAPHEKEEDETLPCGEAKPRGETNFHQMGMGLQCHQGWGGAN
jgi:hypothetical protein